MNTDFHRLEKTTRTRRQVFSIFDPCLSVQICGRLFDDLAVSPVFPFKLIHERDEGGDAFLRERIVDRGPDSADGSVSLQTVQALRRRLGAELFFQFLSRQPESDVHD